MTEKKTSRFMFTQRSLANYQMIWY